MAERAAAQTSARDGGHGSWSHAELLLAAAVDRLGWIHTATYRAQGEKVPYPDAWPRPGVTRRRRLSPAGHAYLQRLADQHAQLHGGGADDTS